MQLSRGEIDIGPAPLPEGQQAWPTTLEIVVSDDTAYSGEPLVSPSGIVIDSEPNYGAGRTVDIIVRDQAGNPISRNAAISETVTPVDAQGEALRERTEVQKNLVRTDENGIVTDTLGAVSRSPASITFMRQNPHVNATFKQTITVYGTFGNEFRKAITLESTYTLTRLGVAITRGTPVSLPRPTK